MKKEVGKILSEKLKERENEGTNQSTDPQSVLADETKEQKIEGTDSSIAGLLQELVYETKKQNKLLADDTKEQKIEGTDSSIAGLLLELICETKKQNKLLSDNKNSSNILEKLIFGFAGLTLFSALASMQLSVMENPTGLYVMYLTYIVIIIGLIILGVIVFTNLVKERENNNPIISSILNILLVSVVGLGISLPIILVIFSQVNMNILMMIIVIMCLLFIL